MKRVFSCFLFQKRPGDGLTPRRRAAFWCWNALLIVGAALALGMASLLLATGYFNGPMMMMDYLHHPMLVVLNLLPPLVLMVLLYGLTGRAWLAYLLTALPVLGLSIGNYYKLHFRDDPVIAADLLLLGEAGNMAGKYQLFLFNKMLVALACAVLLLPMLALLARGKPRGKSRAVTAGAALLCAAALVPAYASDQIYQANANEEHISQWSTTQQYISRGLVYPFLHSIQDAIPHPPAGYKEAQAAAWLAEYEDADIPEGQKVNIVGIMLEAFTDFSEFGQIEFQKDVYAVLHQLEAESYSGHLLTNIFAGGTVDTERAFLTGMGPSNINYRSQTSSYVWYLKGQGYRATGDHPSYEWFYNRGNVNTYLGFDQYRFIENFYQYFPDQDIFWDYTFFPQLTASVLDQLQDDQPLFSFSVSYQGHGPYGDYECWWGEVEDYIANYDLDDASRYILSNYLGSVQSTQGFLADMVDQFRTLDEPVVLVVFGDHKPWLGNGGSVYEALGVSFDQDTVEGFYNYWSTPYLIWGNGAAKEALGVDLVGDGPDVSPCFLMDVLFEQLGWTGSAYMQAVRECRRELPVIHNQGAYLTAEGGLARFATLDDGQAALAQRYRWLEYYRAHHFIS